MTDKPTPLTPPQEARLMQMLAAAPSAPLDDHLTEEDLAAYAAEFLEQAEAERIERHLESCGPCLARMEQMLAITAQWAGQTEVLTRMERLTEAQALGPSAVRRLAGDESAPEPLREKARQALPAAPSTGLLSRLRAFWSFGALQASGATAAAALLLFFVAVRPMLHESDIARLEAQARVRQAAAQTTAAQRQLKRTQDTLATASSRLAAAPSPTELAALRRQFDEQREQQAAEVAALKTQVSRQAKATETTPEEVALPLHDLNALTAGETVRGGLGESEPVAIVSPAGVFVPTDQPMFTWNVQPGEGSGTAASYVVVVWKANDAAQAPLLTSPRISGHTWTATAALPRQVALQWEVKAYTGEDLSAAAPPADRPAKFQIISLARAHSLSRAQTALARADADAGLLTEAADALTSALQIDPKNGAARALLAKVLQAQPK